MRWSPAAWQATIIRGLEAPRASRADEVFLLEHTSTNGLKFHITCDGTSYATVVSPGGVLTNSKFQHIGVSFDRNTQTVIMLVNSKVVFVKNNFGICPPREVNYILVGAWAGPILRAKLVCLGLWPEGFRADVLQQLGRRCPNGNILHVRGRPDYFMGAENTWDSAPKDQSAPWIEGAKIWDDGMTLHGPNAWIADVSTDSYFTLQSPREDMLIRTILSQGSPDHDYWIKSFKLGENRLNDPTWKLYDYSTWTEDAVFTANFDRDSVVYNYIMPTWRATKVKIYVVEYNGKAAGRFSALYVRLGFGNVVASDVSHRWKGQRALDYRTATTEPKDVRGEAGWTCCSSVVAHEHQPYFEFDMGALWLFTRFGTAGMSDPDGWITKYSLRYSVDGVSFKVVADPSGVITIFEANKQGQALQFAYSNVAEIARSIRIMPETWIKVLCSRFVLMGVSYEGSKTPALEVRISSTRITTAAEAEAATLCGETGVPHDTLGGQFEVRCPAGFTGRYLALVPKTKSDLRLCDVKVASDDALNLAANKAVSVSPNMAAVASSQRYVVTDGVFVADETGASGQMCTHGRKLKTALSNRHRSLVMHFVEHENPLTCSGKLAHVEWDARVKSGTAGYLGANIMFGDGEITGAIGATVPYKPVRRQSDESQMFATGASRSFIYFTPSTDNMLEVESGDILSVTHHEESHMYLDGHHIRPNQHTAEVTSGEIRDMGLHGSTPTLGSSSDYPVIQAEWIYRAHIVGPGDTWIAVDLEVVNWVTRVLVFTATDMAGNILANTEVIVGSRANTGIVCNKKYRFPTVHYPGTPVTYFCFETRKGRFVTLRRVTPGLLPVTEIIVF